MKTEVTMIIVILTIVITGNIITQNYAKNYFYNAKKDIENLKQDVLNGDKNKAELQEKIQSIKSRWEENYTVMACFIEHGELEKIAKTIDIIEANIEVEDLDDCIVQIDECIFYLEYISDNETFNLVNIF